MVKEDQTLEDVIATYTILMQKVDCQVPMQLAALWMQFVNELHGFARENQRNEPLMFPFFPVGSPVPAVVPLPKGEIHPLAAPYNPPAAVEVKAVDEPEPAKLVLEAPPYTDERGDIPLDVNMLVRYYHDGSQLELTRLTGANVLRVINGGLQVLSCLLERLVVSPQDRGLMVSAQQAIEKAAGSIGQEADDALVDELALGRSRKHLSVGQVTINGHLAHPDLPYRSPPIPRERESETEPESPRRDPTAQETADKQARKEAGRAKQRASWTPERRQRMRDAMINRRKTDSAFQRSKLSEGYTGTPSYNGNGQATVPAV